MRKRPALNITTAIVAVAITLLSTAPAATGQTPAEQLPGSVPAATCRPEDHPELGLQGQVRQEDFDSGYRDTPITCNADLIGHVGNTSGFKVERFVDSQGNECAYFDSTPLFPVDIATALGVYVVDMNDPTNPRIVRNLITPAMLTPHESLLVNQKRGLLAAVAGNPGTAPGIVDIYDLNDDCRNPQLQSTLPVGLLGHESGFSPDGLTFYATSLVTGNVTAIDVTNPVLPIPLWTGLFSSHGMSLSADGNRAYLASRAIDGPLGTTGGVTVLDVSDIQSRELLPQPEIISTLTWPDISIPQNALPMTINGRHYLMEIDEFAGAGVPTNAVDAPVGSARIIDIENEAEPFVVSTMRLEVQTPEGRAATYSDPGATGLLGGYTAHYCNIPREIDPGIVACSMIASGLRIFDIRDPANPKEIAYFNAPGDPTPVTFDLAGGPLSRPNFAPERGEVWYADAGLYVIRLSGLAAELLNPTAPATPVATPEAPAVPEQPAAPAQVPSTGDLARTGPTFPFWLGLSLLVGAFGFRMVSAKGNAEA